jgi:regulatory protein
MTEIEAFQRARNAAIRFISYRPRSEAEVHRRLRSRFPAQVVDRVVTDLVEQSLIDDTEFAAAWTDTRRRLSPRSANAVMRELLSKGVPADTARNALAGLDDADGALRAARKFARRLEGEDYPAFRRRLWGHLHRRGFHPSIVRPTIARIWEELRRGEEAEDQLGEADDV